MNSANQTYDVIVVGGGQAGLSVGYYLSKHHAKFLILDGQERVGDAWRNRWDSLKLFTTASLNKLPGMDFPGPQHKFPTKDEMADYLEAYAARFELPIRTGIWVEQVSKENGKFKLTCSQGQYWADQVIVAMGNYQEPKIPTFADELDPQICQMHSKEYRNPSQLKEGAVLVVGVGNSGGDIALEVAKTHPTILSGSPSAHIPFSVDGLFARFVFYPILLPLLGHHLLTLDTPIGRKARPKILSHGDPLFRVKPNDFEQANIRRVPKTVGIKDGKPVVEGGEVQDVQNVIWCTGFRPDYSWIKLPIFLDDESRKPDHYRGVVKRYLGMYFVGTKFQYSESSSVVKGVSRDAKYVVDHLYSGEKREASNPETLYSPAD
jgi:putative flavoprotein involved in K+ transport